MKSDKYKQNIVELTENLKENIYTGYDGLFEMVFKAVKNKKRVIAIDSYPLIDWSFIENLVANFYKYYNINILFCRYFLGSILYFLYIQSFMGE